MSDEAFVTTLEALRGWSSQERLGQISVPTLVMEGQSHQPFQEVPDEYNALVTGFWERVDS